MNEFPNCVTNFSEDIIIAVVSFIRKSFSQHKKHYRMTGQKIEKTRCASRQTVAYDPRSM